MMSNPDQPKSGDASDGRDDVVAARLRQIATRQRMIDRWADGQLPLADQRQLLAYCGEHPAAWRELALGLVSAQAWRDALTDAPVVLPGAERRAERAMIGSSGESLRRSSWAAMLVAVALLPLGWWCGYTAAGRQTPRISNTDLDHRASEERQVRHDANPANAVSDPGQTTKATRGDAVVPIRTAAVRQVRSDADLSALAHWASPPDAWLDQAQRSGYDVQVKADLWPARDPQGQAYWVPISQTQLRSPEIWNQ